MSERILLGVILLLIGFVFSILVGAAYFEQQAVMNTATLIGVVVFCIVVALSLGMVLIFCRCKKNQSKKTAAAAKDYEMDSVRRPSIVEQQNQAPPPYYPASNTGLENKALEHSMDLAMALEDQKNAIYGMHGYPANAGMQVQGMQGNECE